MQSSSGNGLLHFSVIDMKELEDIEKKIAQKKRRQ